MKYSKSTNGFYLEEIHGLNIPQDAVEITDAVYKSMLEGQSNGKIITAGTKGKPVLKDPTPPTTEELSASVRAERDALLTKTDWVVIKAQEQSTAIPEVWLTYRNALRDIPLQEGFPSTITWPVKP